MTETELPSPVEIELRAGLHALRFAVAFTLSQLVQRDARAHGVPAASLVANFRQDFVGLLAEARYPPDFKTHVLDDLADIADQVIANAKTFDELGQPEA